jgi:hypothetical protein
MSFLAPREGDLVLFCQHADVCEEYIDISTEACKEQPFHWYYIGGSDGPNMSRLTPQGRLNRRINWMARCDACYRESPELPERVIGQEARWIGPPPEIRND